METLGEKQPFPGTATSVEEVLDMVNSGKVQPPFIIAPWGYEYDRNMDYYIVAENSPTLIQEFTEEALKTASHQARVHVIQTKDIAEVKRTSGVYKQAEHAAPVNPQIPQV